MCGLRKTCTSQISWKCLFYNSLINIMEGMWMCQQGHSAAHVQQHLWAKSIFFLRTAQWQSVPSCCWDQASQVAPHVGMLASYASSNKDMMLNGYFILSACARSCVCSELGGWESGEGVGMRRREKRGSGEEMKENELGKKSKRAQKNKRAEPRSSRQPKRKCRGREKEGSGKLEL